MALEDLLIIHVDHLQEKQVDKGIVITKELNKASGVWSMQSQFSAKSQGTWPEFGYSLDYLVIAGGGGGGNGGQSGGGGSGEFVSPLPPPPGPPVPPA